MDDLFELSATLGLDTKSYDSALDDVLKKTGIKLTDYAVDFAKDVLDRGLKFDEAMAGVFAVTQTTDEAQKNMLETKAIAEASVSAFTTAEVAMAEYYEGLAGFTNEEIVAGLHGIVTAAEASGESLPLVADILTDVTRAFGDDADDINHYADVLAATATSTNTTIGKMGQSLKYVAPIAGSLGFDVEDVALSLGIMADRGTKASQAGTTLRNIFTRLATNAGATTKDLGALEVLTGRLGVAFYDSEGKVRPWIDIIEDARAAWKGLNEEDKDAVLDAVASFAVNGKDADEVLKNLTQDAEFVNNALKKYNTSRTQSEKEESAKIVRDTAASYSELFKILGMEVDPATDDINKLGDSIINARIKLAGLTDEEKIYFSKQIGSMRGMTGWLELMEATEESFVSAKDAIYNALGAADEMRNIRMGSNLWGDIKTFGAAWDALLTTIYNDVKGPLREVVQWGTDAINEIRKAIDERGLAGGVDKLSEKIKELGDNEHFKDMLKTIGEAAAPIITGLLSTLEFDIVPVAASLGSAFAEGFFKGVTESKNVGPISSMVSSFLSNAFGGYNIGSEAADGPQSITTGIAGAIANAVTGGFDMGFGLMKGKNTEIGKLSVDEDGMVAFGGGDTATNSGGAGRWTVPLELDVNGDPAVKAVADVGTEGGKGLTENVDAELKAATTKFQGSIIEGIIDAGKAAGYGFMSLFGVSVNEDAPGIRNDLSDTLGDAGTSAGNDIAHGIQNALNVFKFGVSITGTISNIVNSLGIKKNASAMVSGRIFKKSGIFGYSDGALQMAGDAGAEAVVGVDSLQRMITNAVNNASAGQELIVPRDNGRDLTIILEVDRQQFAKAVYKANNDETQRVGVRFATGGAY